MSHSAESGRTTLADYRLALSTRQARLPIIASLLARLPVAMVGIAELLYVQHETGTYATAGLVSASTLVGVAVGSVAQGRLMDRFGPTRPLLVVAALFGITVAALTLAIEAHVSTPVLVVLAIGIGVFEPSCGSASRALWGRLLPSGPALTAAYSYEAISMEVFFILGPGLAGALIAAPWPGTGMVLAASCMILGAVLFALSPAVRAWPPAARTDTTLLGALASPGMRTLALAALGFGMVIGFVEVAVPAAATEAGNTAMGGVLLSVWSVSSVIFGILFSLRPWPRSLELRLPVLLALFGAGVALLAWPSTLWGLASAMLVAGALITPQSTSHSMTIELVAPKNVAAEAFGWVLTAVTLGLALGQSVSGHLVERSGPPLAFLTAAGCAFVLAGIVWWRKATVRAAEPERADRALV
ncbi:MFS transporter [Saccharomonospora glauca]|uniref:Arabinose efflux permease family protein n=1 Tax=Saccharomonospora glauca K62 TaxID=928724 RepID=I1D7C2_9PSEU|nr:MFS transporter [Saccharomonospora glauca]EIF00847.1 arabinose efflux permease family protein [Saccharomonospora glauca K62]